MNIDAPITLISYLRHPLKRKTLAACYSLTNQTGIEIGGPSDFFKVKGYFPIYAFAKKIDGVNYSTKTVWEGSLKEGHFYSYFKNKIRLSIYKEASDLSQIPDDSYDFLLSCHSLEHVANVIKTLIEWKRILKPGGLLVLVLPDKHFTFDHNRPYTSFEHLLEDYKNDVTECDETGFDEIIDLHDYNMDDGVQSKDEFKARLSKNFENRCAHHHVFNNDLVKQTLEYCGLKIDHQQEILNFHLFTLAKKI